MPKRIILLLFVAIALTSCAGPLKVKYQPGNIQDIPKIKDHSTVLLKPYADMRGVDPAYIGKISSTVSDMNTDKIVLDSEDVATFVTGAMRSHLVAAGYTVKERKTGEEAPLDVDLTISGEVNKFRLDIGTRDEIEIELATMVTENKTDKVVWSGIASEKSDRYAGVTGNSRRTIAGYISKTLRMTINKTLKEINVNTQTISALPAPGIVGAKDRAILEVVGRLVIKTEPPRAQIYIGDVYYGLSPLTIDIAQGIYDTTIKLKGFKTVKEKISIRNGDATEMDLSLEKEAF